MIYVETLGNPTMVVADIPALAALAHARGIKLVVDNTFTPMIVSPARLGADVVVIFPGLASHPGHERFKSIANAGSVVDFPNFR